jgi:hypothetical protein
MVHSADPAQKALASLFFNFLLQVASRKLFEALRTEN